MLSLAKKEFVVVVVIRLNVVHSCCLLRTRVTCQVLLSLKLGCWLRRAGFFYNFRRPIGYSNLLQILLVLRLLKGSELSYASHNHLALPYPVSAIIQMTGISFSDKPIIPQDLEPFDPVFQIHTVVIS